MIFEGRNRTQDDANLLRRAVDAGVIQAEDADRIMREKRSGESLIDAVRSSVAIPNDQLQDILNLIAAESTDGKAVERTPTIAAAIDGLGKETGPLQLPGLPNRYQLREEVGRGGMGCVYRAVDTELNRQVAIKVLLGDVDRDDFRTLMQRERQVLAALDDPGIVAIYDSGQLADGSPFYAMQFVEGLNLNDYCRRANLDCRETLALVLQIARSVHKAHLLRIIHRDLKPQNIRVTGNGDPKVLDFGLAKQTELSADGQSGKGELTTIAGTPAYMSPEQAAGHQTDARSDVYALGVILYELLSGERPFDPDADVQNPSAPTPNPLADALATHNPIWLRKRKRAIPREVALIVHKCLHRRAGSRYDDAGELAADIGRYLDGRAVAAVPRWRGAYALWKFVSRYRWHVLGIVTAIALIMIVVASAFIRIGQANIRISQAKQVADEARKRAEAGEETIRRERDEYATQLQRDGTQRAIRFLREGRFDDAAGALATVPQSRRGWEHERMHYEIGLAAYPEIVIGQHDWPIWDLQISPDGRRVVSSGQDGRVIVWEISTGQPTELEQGTWSDESRRWQLVVDKTTGEVVGAGVIRVCWIPGSNAVAGAAVQAAGPMIRGRGLIWDLGTGKKRQLFEQENALTAVSASPTGDLLFSDAAGYVRLVSAAEPETWQQTKVSQTTILCSCYVDNYWCVADSEGVVHLLDGTATRVLSTLHLPGPIRDLCSASDTHQIAVATDVPAAIVLRIDDQGQLREFARLAVANSEKEPAQSVHAVCFASDSMQLWAMDDLGRLNAWDLETKRLKFARLDQKARPLKPDVIDGWRLFLQGRLGMIQTSNTGKALFTAGYNTIIKKWHTGWPSGKAEFDFAAAEPRVAFSLDDGQFWLADVTGTLTLIDSHSGEPSPPIDAHPGPISALSRAANVDIVATCSDKTIRFWRSSQNEIIPAHAEIRHDEVIRDISLDPAGGRIVAYDVADEIHLWDVASGRRLCDCQMPANTSGEVATGHVRFNRDGSLVAAAGANQSFWILAAANLQLIEKPYLANGDGGTALAWHPSQARRLVGGDTDGLLFTWPGARRVASSYSQSGRSRIVGISYTPAGDRYAAAAEDGSVLIVDPNYLGVVYEFQARELPAQSGVEGGRRETQQIVGVEFDASGERLLVAYRDGLIQIWETRHRQSAKVSIRPARKWDKNTLIELPSEHYISYRSHAVQISKTTGRLYMLYVDFKRNDDSETGVCRLKLLKETSNGSEERTIETIEIPDRHTLAQTQRSLSLDVSADKIYAVFRRPLPDQDGLLGELVMAELSDVQENFAKAAIKLTTITQPENFGFDTHVFLDETNTPEVFHFSHAGHYFMATRRIDGDWKTVTVGRQGIGLYSEIVMTSKGESHIICPFAPFNGKRSPHVYVSLGSWPHAQAVPKEFDHTYETIARSVALDSAGVPVILYQTSKSNHPAQFFLTSPSANGWERRGLGQLELGTMSSLLIDRKDNPYLAYVDRANSIYLAKISEAGTSAELVWEGALDAPVAPDEGSYNFGFPPVLRFDSHDRPVILHGGKTAGSKQLHSFRPAASD